MPRRRLRTFTLWTGTTLCVLIAAAFVASGWWAMAAQVPKGRGPTIGMVAGAVFTVLDEDFHRDMRWNQFHIGRNWEGRSWRRWDDWVVSAHPTYHIPAYAFFLAVALPTLLVWRFVPKFPRGHCRRCGYNLKGLTEARCPECGAGFDMVKRALPPGH